MNIGLIEKETYFSDDDIAKDVVDAAFYVHKHMGVGLLESVYEQCFCHVLASRGIAFECQKTIPVFLDGKDMGIGFKADIVVGDSIIIEIKSVERLNDIHAAQLMNYMRLSGIKIGFLINFNERMFKEGIKRFVI